MKTTTEERAALLEASRHSEIEWSHLPIIDGVLADLAESEERADAATSALADVHSVRYVALEARITELEAREKALEQKWATTLVSWRDERKEYVGLLGEANISLGRCSNHIKRLRDVLVEVRDSDLVAWGGGPCGWPGGPQQHRDDCDDRELCDRLQRVWQVIADTYIAESPTPSAGHLPGCRCPECDPVYNDPRTIEREEQNNG